MRTLTSFSNGMPAHRELDVQARFILHKWPLNFHYGNILEVGFDQVAGLEQAPAKLQQRPRSKRRSLDLAAAGDL